VRLFADSETFVTAPGAMAPRVVASGFAGDIGQVTIELGSGVWAWALRTPGVEMVGHNVAFDLACACAEDPSLLPLAFDAFESGRVRDTMVREKLLVNARERLPSIKGYFSLAETYARHRGCKARDKSTDTWRLRYSELDGVPVEAWPEEARQYLREDVEETRFVFGAQGDVGPDEVRQTCAAWWLHLCATWGIVTDLPRVAKLRHRLEWRAGRIRRALIKIGLVRPSKVLKSGPRKGLEIEGSRNVKAVRERVLAAYGAEVPRTPSGEPATDDLTCRESGDRGLRLYGMLGKLNATISKDLPLLETGQCHTFFGFTANGRSSSSRPNIQNIARRGGIRPCFVPRPGLTMISADYGSLELCTLAQVCLDLFGRSKLAEDLNADRSPLLSFASMMLGISYDEAAARRKLKDERVENARQSAKIALYGFSGGLGARALVGFALSKYNVRLTERQAHELKNHWHRYDPVMRDYFAHCTRVVDSGGVVKQLRSGRVRAGCTFTDAANTYFSGLGADIAKSAGFAISRQAYCGPGPLFGWRMINMVHDSWMLEGPPEGAEAVGPELSRIMIE
jgi:hypothetical protein